MKRHVIITFLLLSLGITEVIAQDRTATVHFTFKMPEVVNDHPLYEDFDPQRYFDYFLNGYSDHHYNRSFSIYSSIWSSTYSVSWLDGPDWYLDDEYWDMYTDVTIEIPFPSGVTHTIIIPEDISNSIYDEYPIAVSYAELIGFFPIDRYSIGEREEWNHNMYPVSITPGEIGIGEHNVEISFAADKIMWGTNWQFDLNDGGYVWYTIKKDEEWFDSDELFGNEIAGKYHDFDVNNVYFLTGLSFSPDPGKVIDSVTLLYEDGLGNSTETSLPYSLSGESVYGGFLYEYVGKKICFNPGWMNTIIVRFKEDDRYITFADPNVKAICLANWNLNNDDELSLAEAAAVTDLGKVFSKNSTITSFDELQYFTGLTSIPSQAFFNCTALTSITIPKNVTEIGQNALSGCSAMTTINVDADNQYFTSVDGVFFNKAKTTLVQYPLAKCIEYAVPAGTVTIGRDAFFNSTLSSITLPTSLKTLDFDALGYCKYLTEIELPSGLETIGEYALDHCTGLSSITIPTSVTSIGNKAFNYCNNLALVICQWTDNPTAIPDNVFPDAVFENAVLLVPEGTRQLYKATSGWMKFNRIVEERNANITFADANVKSICVAHWDTNNDGQLSFKEAAVVLSLGDAFTGNTSIKSFKELQFFTALSKIDDNAFSGCKYLTSVIVPENVRQIGKSAFYGCYKLNNIVLPEGLEVIDEKGIGACTSLTSINLPSTLTSIKKQGFYYDTKLASISLPASITSIGSSAFASCSALLDVTANMQTPCTIASNVFTTNTFNNATLHVPNGKLNTYKTTNYWSKFTHIEEMEGQANPEIAANAVSVVAGSDAALTLSLTDNAPIVSFQFDMTLADGLSLSDAAMVPASDFVVTTSNLAANQWRVTGYSPTNTALSENVGALISLTLHADESLQPGSVPVQITGFVMTDNAYNSIEVADCSTTVTVTAAPVLDGGKGDVNLDGQINVQDIVVLLNYIHGTTPNKFSAVNADANSDGKINISDISAIVGLCMNSNPNAAPAHAPAANTATVTWDTTDGLALSIGDANYYVAAQMDITTDGTLTLNGITTEDNHAAVWQQVGDRRYRVLVFSNANDTFSAFGPHLFFDMEGEGNLSLSNVLLVDANGEGYTATDTSTGYATGITTLTDDLSAPADVYSVSGQLVRRQATSLKHLPAGIYIVNGKKMVIK